MRLESAKSQNFVRSSGPTVVHSQRLHSATYITQKRSLGLAIHKAKLSRTQSTPQWKWGAPRNFCCDDVQNPEPGEDLPSHDAPKQPAYERKNDSAVTMVLNAVSSRTTHISDVLNWPRDDALKLLHGTISSRNFAALAFQTWRASLVYLSHKTFRIM